jgi:DGQHR domain-containing protein
MKTSLLNTTQGSFLKIELAPINQKGNQFFVGKINAKDFLRVFTVRPAEYDVKKYNSLTKAFKDDSEYYSHLIKRDEKRIAEKDFQRDYDPTRVSKISQFLEEEEYPFFPNSIIATCDLINTIDDLGIDEAVSFEDFLEVSDRPTHLSFLQSTEGTHFLYVPYTEDAILIIDGQHRLRGLAKSSEALQENYELLVSFIIDFDRSVIAKLFYTINYEQKSVNKSLLYHLTGEFSDELDELTFMHNVVKVLNELDSSPFYNKIKMLGKNPSTATQAEKEHLTISQAFLIDYLIKSISKNSRNSTFQPIFLYYYRHREMQIEIIRFLIKYFDAVRDLKKQDWNNPSGSILTKGMGLAALIKVMHFLFVHIFVNDWKFNPEKIKDITKKYLAASLSGIENVDFSKAGEFGGVGSGGTINKLTQRIIENLKFSEGHGYKDYVDRFKKSEWMEFKNWLGHQVKL